MRGINIPRLWLIVYLGFFIGELRVRDAGGSKARGVRVASVQDFEEK